jgi:hypothetical protein
VDTDSRLSAVHHFYLQLFAAFAVHLDPHPNRITVAKAKLQEISLATPFGRHNKMALLVRLGGAQRNLPIRTELFDQNTSHRRLSRVVHNASQRQNNLRLLVLDCGDALSMQTGGKANEKATDNPEDSRKHALL